MKTAMAIILAGVTLVAQAPAARPTFGVVSIKPEAPDAPPVRVGSMPFFYSPGGERFRSSAITALALVSQAFSTPGRFLRPSQIIGLPSWATTTRFEIIATAPDGMNFAQTNAQFGGLVLAVLEERFKLKAHLETRAFPVYALVKARSDGRLGAQIHESKVDCDKVSKDQSERLQQIGRQAFAAEMMAQMTTGKAPCQTSIGPSRQLIGNDITMKTLAGAIGADRPIMDRTGLDGRYTLELQWTPTTLAATSADLSAAAPTSDGASIFVALQEQLGLKLEPRDEPMDALVIEHIEPPTPN
jgi:uncharacterized protein (TIGR03435 family)